MINNSQQTGAEAIIHTLEKLGVEYIFGYSGGAAIPIFDAIVTTKTKIQMILARHEQGAAHMADGYARSTGKPGVVLVTSGPGAGNIITGLMTAHMDSVPLIAITGQQIRPMLGLDAFQEADVYNLTMPVTKHNYLAMSTNSLPQILYEAFEIATSGRPGPVLIDVPKDVSSAVFSGNFAHKPSAVMQSVPEPQPNVIQRISEIVANAERPVILAGHGVLLAKATSELAKMAQQFDIPVVTTLLGKGAIDEHSPLSFGMLGMHGTAYANKAILESDVLLNIGSRFDDRIIGDGVTFTSGKTVIHIDIDAAEIGKMIKPDIAVIGDAKQFLQAMTATEQQAAHTEWRRHLQAYRDKYKLHYVQTDKLTQQQVLESLNRQIDANAYVATDVGQHQMWAAQYMQVTSPDHWISSGGAGTMGFGFPSAIGAQFGHRDSQVVAIVGDGGFQMTLYELSTIAIHRLPVKIFVMNNHYLGMVRQWQELFYDNRLSGVDLEGNPDFVKLAESYSINAIEIAEPADVDRMVKKALDYPGPVLINCEVAKTDNVYPMIPAGRPYTDMLISAPTTKLEKPIGST